MGYSYGKKASRLFDLENHEYFENMDVTFYVEVSPFHESRNPKKATKNPPLGLNQGAILDDHSLDATSNAIEVPFEVGQQENTRQFVHMGV